MAFLAVLLLYGCASGENTPEGDSPRTVTFEGRPYFVSCSEVHPSRLGEPVDAIYDPAVRFRGANIAFESRAIVGFDRSEAIALSFGSERRCGKNLGLWTAATSRDLAYYDQARQIEILEAVGSPP